MPGVSDTVQQWLARQRPEHLGAMAGAALGGTGLGLIGYLSSEERNRRRNALLAALLGGAAGGGLGYWAAGQAGQAGSPGAAPPPAITPPPSLPIPAQRPQATAQAATALLGGMTPGMGGLGSLGAGGGYLGNQALAADRLARVTRAGPAAPTPPVPSPVGAAARIAGPAAGGAALGGLGLGGLTHLTARSLGARGSYLHSPTMFGLATGAAVGGMRGLQFGRDRQLQPSLQYRQDARVESDALRAHQNQHLLPTAELPQ